MELLKGGMLTRTMVATNVKTSHWAAARVNRIFGSWKRHYVAILVGEHWRLVASKPHNWRRDRDRDLSCLMTFRLLVIRPPFAAGIYLALHAFAEPTQHLLMW